MARTVRADNERRIERATRDHFLQKMLHQKEKKSIVEQESKLLRGNIDEWQGKYMELFEKEQY